MHVVYIAGNRPQFIKLAMLHKKMKDYPFVRESLIHTGQHFSADMSDVFFRELSIEIPVVNLGIHSLSHIALIGRTLELLEVELKKSAPDLVVVFGDTNATLAGALAAKKLNLPVMHIEAGIRTFDESMPEESNRYLADRLASLNFCCTYLGVENLKKEGYDGQQINTAVINSGDLMLDAFLYFDKEFAGKQTNPGPASLNEFVLATIHRRQNIEDIDALKAIVEALNEIHHQTPVVCPLHPNTKGVLERNEIKCFFSLLPPQGYLPMQQLIRKAQYVITDSGGVQREAFFAQKPTLILMEKPFWPEVISHGNALHCKSEKENICDQFAQLKMLQNPFDVSVFGNGNAAGIIAEEMIRYYESIKRNFK